MLVRGKKQCGFEFTFTFIYNDIMLSPLFPSLPHQFTVESSTTPAFSAICVKEEAMHLYASIPNHLGNAFLLLNIKHLLKDIQLHQMAISISFSLVLGREAFGDFLQLW